MHCKDNSSTYVSGISPGRIVSAILLHIPLRLILKFHHRLTMYCSHNCADAWLRVWDVHTLLFRRSFQPFLGLCQYFRRILDYFRRVFLNFRRIFQYFRQFFQYFRRIRSQAASAVVWCGTNWAVRGPGSLHGAQQKRPLQTALLQVSRRVCHRR